VAAVAALEKLKAEGLTKLKAEADPQQQNGDAKLQDVEDLRFDKCKGLW